MRCFAFLLAVGITACEADPAASSAGASPEAHQQPSAPADPATPKEPPVRPNPEITLLKPTIAAGQDVEIWVRPAGENPFMENHTPFQHRGTLQAVAAPYGGGGVTGAQIWKIVHADGSASSEVWARSLQLGPRSTTGAGITVDDAGDEYFDNYVGQTADARLLMLIEVVPMSDPTGMVH